MGLFILLPEGQPLRGGLIAVRAGVGLWVGHTAIIFNQYRTFSAGYHP
jgi:hypothetical protein